MIRDGCWLYSFPPPPLISFSFNAHLTFVYVARVDVNESSSDGKHQQEPQIGSVASISDTDSLTCKVLCGQLLRMKHAGLKSTVWLQCAEYIKLLWLRE